MAKLNRGEKYTKATIDIANNKIYEIDKDGIREYSLSEFLQRWDNISDINISVGINEDLPVVE